MKDDDALAKYGVGVFWKYKFESKNILLYIHLIFEFVMEFDGFTFFYICNEFMIKIEYHKNS